ncbi:DNA polymerase family A-domain-containing protein [Daldinia vernicosa]|uniref:DNA polymerase family A-domain-containing protein n=1 Tax=Daldinia vernicosa TaxID=114800 RepID=UPI002007EAB2|nr:DNA polymerase family A-domain-containing protein [Daldinia vernicosa]KAI0851075.1 DNA polymerase family A-domain-containing protein [Daldinia vernicosa]
MLHPAKGRIRSASTSSFVRLANRVHSHPCRPWPWLSPLPSHLRRQTTATATATAAAQGSKAPQAPRDPPSQTQAPIPNLANPSGARFNEIGVQQVSARIYEQIFKNGSDPPPQELVDLSIDHLQRHDLFGKNTDNTAPIAFDVPELQGKTLDEHFYKLGMDCANPYLGMAKAFAESMAPSRPREWVRQSGWTKYYNDGTPPEKVEFPDADTLCFDVEVMWKESSFAVMACAMSPKNWYAWLSPWLLGESESDRHLIPLGDPNKERIIVGHNIGYDRARILEEYDLKQSRNSFLDTMSLHVAVNGMCSQQRPTWMKHQKNKELRDKITKETDNVELINLLAHTHEDEEELWVERSSINSLRDVAKFHLNIAIDKAARDQFGELDREGVLGKLSELLDYCAADVVVTHKVYRIIFPNFLKVCPHPVSFAALRHLSSVILPVNKSWDAYVQNAEATYHRLSDSVQERLVSLAEKAVEIKDDADKWGNDPWLKQLDWSGQEIKMVKGKKKGDPPRPAARQKKPGMPKWYKDLFKKIDSEMSLTVRTRIAPLLLRLAWDGYPLVWSDKYGWTFKVPLSDMSKYSSTQLVECDFSDEPIEALKHDRTGIYFKLPHKDGPNTRCVNPLAKGYLVYFENGTLSSEYPLAKEALDMNASCSYWISARSRITSQMVVYEKNKVENSEEDRTKKDDYDLGYILPQIIPMGTITRRAVENTWLTASNAKKNRVGSELKAMVKAPPGYCFVGADVDSEELWIASVIGDATFKLHGGNAIGFMTLEGTKAAGTDLHSRTASILGITRNNAKVFNYGRIYGAGLKFAATLLRQFNPSLSEKETLDIAGKLYATTKGTKTTRKTLSKRPFWRGGTESFVFNKLEEFAEQDRPRTPVLGAGITEALLTRYISKGGYLTSRINWAIQSSGVDYLHLLIVSMDYLIRRFNIAARLAISVHDEIRYLVKDEDKYRAAMALQVANLWTRAMFAQQVGINDLPQACAYFSAIDIDHILRKEVDMDCVTPSHLTPIPPGESLDIMQLLEKGDEAKLNPATVPAEPVPKPEKISYQYRVPVMEELNKSQDPTDLSFLKAQITNDDQELRQILKDQKKNNGDGSASVVDKPRQKKLVPYSSQPQLIPHMYKPFGAKFTSKQQNYGSAGEQWTFECMPPPSLPIRRA